MKQGQPLFSLVIPTYNRPQQLTGCLTALARLDYPRDRFEVIVVDDGSGTKLDSVVAPFRQSFELTLLRQVNEGPSSARNRGAARAQGRFLAFTDDDCAPAPNWLRTLEARFTRVDDSVIVGGRVLNALPDNLYSTASQLIVDVGVAYHNADPERAHFFTANNLAVPAARFGALGGFNRSFNLTASEDRELCGRWLHQGYRMIYAPEAVVYHAHSLTWHTFWQQHLNYGRGALLLQRARKREGWQLFKPDPRYYMELLSSPFSRVSTRQAFWLAALLVVSQAATAAGILSEWFKQYRAKGVCPVEI